MIEYYAVMVVMDKNGKEGFISVLIDEDKLQYPQNTPQEIRRLVDYCNERIEIDGMRFVDCSGIVVDGEIELWEIDDD